MAGAYASLYRRALSGSSSSDSGAPRLRDLLGRERLYGSSALARQLVRELPVAPTTAPGPRELAGFRARIRSLPSV